MVDCPVDFFAGRLRLMIRFFVDFALDFFRFAAAIEVMRPQSFK